MNKHLILIAALFSMSISMSTAVYAMPAIFNLVLDGTGSMSDAQFRTQVNSAREFIMACHQRSQQRGRAGERSDWIVVNLFGGPNEYRGPRFANCSNRADIEAMRRWLDNRPHPRWNSTAIYNAIVSGTMEVKRKWASLPGDYMQVLIVVTDGQDTSSTQQAKNSVRSYYGSGSDQVFLYMIGVTSAGRAGLREFESVADRTIAIGEFSELQSSLFILLSLMGVVAR